MAEADPHVVFAISLEGTEIARMLSIALFSLAVYEYLITLDEEIKYFWTGKWTLSRVLFLVNRYLALSIMAFSIVCYSIPNPSVNFCKPAIQLALSLNILAIGTIQAMLAARVWYLFQGKMVLQCAIIAAFFASLASSFILLGLSVAQIKVIPGDFLAGLFPGYINEGCKVTRPPHIWRIFLPSLVLHTILYILTAYRALKNRHLLKQAPILKRLLRDGGFFYFVVFASVMITTVFSFLENKPRLNIPAIYSHFLLAATSIAISRVMFSIHSLAEKLGSDTAWLLTNAQLSRVSWRKGRHSREIFVDRTPVYSDIEMDVKLDRASTKSSFGSTLRETHVGKWDADLW